MLVSTRGCVSHSGHRGQTTTLSNRVPVRRFLQESVKKVNDLRNVTFQQASGGRRTTPSPERLRLRKERTRTGGAGERAARPFGGSSHSQVGGAGSEASTRLTLKRLACRDGKPKRDTWPQNCSVTQQARDEGRRAPGPCGQLPRRLPASTHSHPPVTAASHPLWRHAVDGLIPTDDVGPGDGDCLLLFQKPGSSSTSPRTCHRFRCGCHFPAH